MKALLSLAVLTCLLSGCAIYPAAPAGGVYLAPPSVVITPEFYYHRDYDRRDRDHDRDWHHDRDWR